MTILATIFIVSFLIVELIVFEIILMLLIYITRLRLEPYIHFSLSR